MPLGKRSFSLAQERAIKGFYGGFQSIREQLRAAIEGCSTEKELEHCTSLLLNSLMFLYFLQKKGYLDGNRLYLPQRLAMLQRQGSSFLVFYLHLLRRLFHAPYEQSIDTDRLIGQIPYLGGNLFNIQIVLHAHARLRISNEPFEIILTFFEQWQWQLDELPLPNEQTLTPSILGSVFEQYVNQQQMGAYYTKEDVTHYIASCTIIPYLFDAVRQDHPAAFVPDAPIWQLLHTRSYRYVLPGKKHEETINVIDSIDDFVTLNLDLRSFAHDAIMACQDPNVLHAWWEHLQRISVLDPTCGSGAFLFAALDVLEALYAACLERMQAWPAHFSSRLFQKLYRTSNRSYAIRTQVLQQNLYGVDMMEEATDICMLRLSLKLLALVEGPEEIEALPSLHHRIRAGNALVGYSHPPITQSTDHSIELCNRLLARTYGIQSSKAFDTWYQSHQPFHWCYEFEAIMKSGGFSVIIGNPPYVEYEARKFSYTLQGFETLLCCNLYTCVIERSRQLLAPSGRNGMIVPLAAFATRNMRPFLEAFQRWFSHTWLSFYHFRPSMLFHGTKAASIPTTIYLAKPEGPERRYSTSIHKWRSNERDLLFSRLRYCLITAPRDPENRHYYPKFGTGLENSIMHKVLMHQKVEGYLASAPGQNSMYYRSAGGLYWKVFVNFAWPYTTTSNKTCSFQQDYDRDVFTALFNSSLFWWYYTVTFDTFNLKDYMLFGFRFTYPTDRAIADALSALCQLLMDDFRRHARHLTRGTTGSYTIYARQSRSIINQIDHVLAQHYGFTPEELAFLVNYDSAFRLGQEAAGSPQRGKGQRTSIQRE